MCVVKLLFLENICNPMLHLNCDIKFLIKKDVTNKHNMKSKIYSGRKKL